MDEDLHKADSDKVEEKPDKGSEALAWWSAGCDMEEEADRELEQEEGPPGEVGLGEGTEGV